MSNSVRPHRWQPTRLLCPQDSLGKNTGVGGRFLLQCFLRVKKKKEHAVSVAHKALTINYVWPFTEKICQNLIYCVLYVCIK